MSTASFYDQMAPFYELIYPDWEASMARQANQLSSIIRGYETSPSRTVLDASCGIGTQALGLAKLGYAVTASDLSSCAIERASREAQVRNLQISFSVCDMRAAYIQHSKSFDVVISADNSIPHLLSDKDILVALGQLHSCTNPGGLCILTVRDYEKEDLRENVIKPYAVKQKADGRYIVFQIWNVDGVIYETSMYCLKDLKSGTCESFVTRAKYYAISTTRLVQLMQKSGFLDAQRLDNVFFQPVVIGRRGDSQ